VALREIPHEIGLEWTRLPFYEPGGGRFESCTGTPIVFHTTTCDEGESLSVQLLGQLWCLSATALQLESSPVTFRKSRTAERWRGVAWCNVMILHRARRFLWWAGFAVLAATCGHSSGSSGPTTAPSPPSAQPAGVNVAGHWTGQESHAQGGGPLTLDLMQSGNQVTGNLSGFGHAGPFAGTVAGNTLSFNFSYGMGGAGCGNALSGTATIGPDFLSGTFSGQDCAGQAVTNGNMSLTLAPPSMTSAPISGTWEGNNVEPAIGGGSWTWALSQSTGDVYGGNLTGSIEVFNNSQGLSTGSVTGTVTTTFPGPTSKATFTVNLSGPCAVTLTVNNASIARQQNGTEVLGGNSSVTNCHGPVAAGGIGLVRVGDSTTLPPASLPAVNLTGNWSGPANDSAGSVTISAQLTQSGGYVYGPLTAMAADVMRGGNLQGVLTGSTLTFTLNVGPAGKCPVTVNGTAQVSNASIVGSYSGTSCQDDVNNGTLTLRRQ